MHMHVGVCSLFGLALLANCTCTALVSGISVTTCGAWCVALQQETLYECSGPHTTELVLRVEPQEHKTDKARP